MIYVVHIVKEIKPLSCNWMDYVSLKKENRVRWVSFLILGFYVVFLSMGAVQLLYLSLLLLNFW